VRTPEGVETVGLNGSTAFYKGRTPASRSDVRPGEVVRIRLADPRASTKVASVVVLVPARISGWVTKVDDASLTVTDRDGFTRTIRTTGATTYEKDGATAARAVVAVGTFVHALGSVDADGTTLDAERVLVGRPARPAGAPDGGPDA
jgi:hypothetical protein